MDDRYPGYDVMAKRHTPSWNETTRRVIDQRLASPRHPRFLTGPEWNTLKAICARIVPQPSDRPPVPLAAMVDGKLFHNNTDGYRHHHLPPLRDAWRRALAALNEEAQARYGTAFAELSTAEQDALLHQMQAGDLRDPAWDDMPCQTFFAERLLHDIVNAYYTHPTAWNEIGFGGPASPRGYVRMGFNRRDPWEAAEAHVRR